MEISFHSHLDSNTMIATKFCTWHDSCAVVACAKICCDLMASNGVTARRTFHRIWIAGIKMLVKQAPGSRFNIKMTSYRYRKSHCGDKTILRPSYLHNGISYTGKTTSLYWIRPLVSSSHNSHTGLSLSEIMINWKAPVISRQNFIDSQFYFPSCH